MTEEIVRGGRLKPKDDPGNTVLIRLQTNGAVVATLTGPSYRNLTPRGLLS
jgi:NOL1/NOP2/fmu family ribosome biogenesis protein